MASGNKTECLQKSNVKIESSRVWYNVVAATCCILDQNLCAKLYLCYTAFGLIGILQASCHMHSAADHCFCCVAWQSGCNDSTISDGWIVSYKSMS